MFVCDRIRSQKDQQKVPLRHLLSTAQPKLVEIVELMEANIEELIDLGELSEHVGISRRQLERLFNTYLNSTPSRYYFKLRLERSRQLLKQTKLTIIEVSSACGFVSTAHFSRCYRKHFGLSPREDRTEKQKDNCIDKQPATASFDIEGYATVQYSSEKLSSASTESSYASVKLKA